jgi:hypothetical protein
VRPTRLHDGDIKLREIVDTTAAEPLIHLADRSQHDAYRLPWVVAPGQPLHEVVGKRPEQWQGNISTMGVEENGLDHRCCLLSWAPQWAHAFGKAPLHDSKVEPT